MRLLSGVEVSELRLWWTAVPPRPSQLRPDPQLSAPGLRSRAFYSRLSLSTSFGLPTLPARASFVVGFPGLRPFRLPVLPAYAFRSVGLRQPKLLTDLSIFPSRSSSCSADLPGPEPKLDALSGLAACRGLRLLASISRDHVSFSIHPLVARPALAEPGLGDVLSTT